MIKFQNNLMCLTAILVQLSYTNKLIKIHSSVINKLCCKLADRLGIASFTGFVVS